jgi:hypothetical protein
MGEDLKFWGWGVGALSEHAACGVLRVSEMLSCGSRPCWWTAKAQGFAGCERGRHKGWWALQKVRSHQREDRVVPVDCKGVVRSDCAHP